jgi:hypothetical protein
VEQAAEPITSDDLDFSVGRIGHCPQRTGLVQAPMGSMGVEVGFILGEDLPELRGINDQDPVQDLAAYAAPPSVP